MNETLRKLTLINVVFLPLNLIASIGGMSEFSMMTAGVPWWLAYAVLVLAMLLLGVLMVLALKRLARSGRHRGPVGAGLSRDSVSSGKEVFPVIAIAGQVHAILDACNAMSGRTP